MVVAMTSWGKRDLMEHYGLPDEKVRVVPWGSVLWEYPEPSPRDLSRSAGAPLPPGPVPALPGADLAAQEP